MALPRWQCTPNLIDSSLIRRQITPSLLLHKRKHSSKIGGKWFPLLYFSRIFLSAVKHHLWLRTLKTVDSHIMYSIKSYTTFSRSTCICTHMVVQCRNPKIFALNVYLLSVIFFQILKEFLGTSVTHLSLNLRHISTVSWTTRRSV